MIFFDGTPPSSAMSLIKKGVSRRIPLRSIQRVVRRSIQHLTGSDKIIELQLLPAAAPSDPAADAYGWKSGQAVCFHVRNRREWVRCLTSLMAVEDDARRNDLARQLQVECTERQIQLASAKKPLRHQRTPSTEEAVAAVSSGGSRASPPPNGAAGAAANAASALSSLPVAAASAAVSAASGIAAFFGDISTGYNSSDSDDDDDADPIVRRDEDSTLAEDALQTLTSLRTRRSASIKDKERTRDPERDASRDGTEPAVSEDTGPASKWRHKISRPLSLLEQSVAGSMRSQPGTPPQTNASSAAALSLSPPQEPLEAPATLQSELLSPRQQGQAKGPLATLLPALTLPNTLPSSLPGSGTTSAIQSPAPGRTTQRRVVEGFSKLLGQRPNQGEKRQEDSDAEPTIIAGPAAASSDSGERRETNYIIEHVKEDSRIADLEGEFAASGMRVLETLSEIALFLEKLLMWEHPTTLVVIIALMVLFDWLLEFYSFITLTVFSLILTAAAAASVRVLSTSPSANKPAKSAPGPQRVAQQQTGVPVATKATAEEEEEAYCLRVEQSLRILQRIESIQGIVVSAATVEDGATTIKAILLLLLVLYLSYHFRTVHLLLLGLILPGLMSRLNRPRARGAFPNEKD
eukprot:TRINITY_DN1067_c0_g1_i2.p1 TRINITY_DN1067_c0_g1~~TRINITY_DN1067_c0_g1_i2.p1  ORF type:complete len:699 (+),score=153.01 TRINITY_DN1067_c0_g1_i2:193-2097(+)